MVHTCSPNTEVKVGGSRSSLPTEEVQGYPGLYGREGGGGKEADKTIYLYNRIQTVH